MAIDQQSNPEGGGPSELESRCTGMAATNIDVAMFVVECRSGKWIR
jgi:hypothetical protein